FEFRMVGSSASIAGPNVVLNTIAAESLDELAARLEKASDISAELAKYVKDVMAKHGRIIFNGNNYSEEWVSEAAKRGLPNVRNCVDALKAFVTPESEALFEKYKVLAKAELHSRYEIYTEQYAKHINIEANTASQMVRRQYLPAALSFLSEMKGNLDAVKTEAAADLLKSASALVDSAYAKLKKLEDNTKRSKSVTDVVKQAESYRDTVVTTLAELRSDVDALESLVSKDLWPVPYYSDMLFNL
ncbi:MAG: glutamine synthetase type III, partial [Spirochaetota bacterium]